MSGAFGIFPAPNRRGGGMGVPPLFLYPGCRSMQRTLRGWMQGGLAAYGAGGK